MSVLIRPLELSDRETVFAMADRLETGVACWRDPVRVRAAVRQWVRSSVEAGSEGAAVLVAVSEDEVVGFVSVAQQEHWCGELDAYIGELVVREDHEGRGIGRDLVTAAEAWAADRGLARIRVATGAANIGALRLYESAGFEREDVVLSRSLERGP